MAPLRAGLLAGFCISILVAHASSAPVEGKYRNNSMQGPIGVSSGCGGSGCGVAFSIDIETGAETTLHTFQQNGNDGYYPVGGMVPIGDSLYGVTEDGGSVGAGTIFKIAETGGEETVLYAFKDDGDGLYPLAGLTRVGKILYGTTSQGGNGQCGEFGCGNVFSIDPKTAGETVIHSFTGEDGYYPSAGLIAIGKRLFGTTNAGGNPNDCGVDRLNCVVFSLKLKGDAESTLYTFAGGTEGSPGNGRLLDKGKYLYGTTPQGGTYSGGTAFSIKRTSGAKTLLHAFGNGQDGTAPEGGLTVVGSMLYGTTCGGGTNSRGTVYSINPQNGSETVIYYFTGNDGACPVTNLINIAGILYGTTQSGGSGNFGTVFSINPSTGAENVVHSFDGTDGVRPNSDLVYADGKLFGTTSFGGP